MYSFSINSKYVQFCINVYNVPGLYNVQLLGQSFKSMAFTTDKHVPLPNVYNVQF